jgi:hypothetical protein
MKILHALALIVLLSVVALGQAQDRSDLDATYALKGPVRTFRTEVATFILKDGEYVEGPRVPQMEATFNRDGNRTDFYIYNREGKVGRRIVMKYVGRKMVEAINYDGAGQMWLRIVDSYNEAGQVKESISYNGDGSVRSTTQFQRNARGQLVQKTERSAQGILMEQINNKFEGRDLYTSERKLYDSIGTLAQEEIYVAPNKRTIIRYNGDGSVASRSVRVGQEVAYYGPDGALQKATVIAPEDRLLDEMIIKNDKPTTRQTQLPDETDPHGNWTKQTKWLAEPKGTRPLTVTYRALTYYEN